MLLKVNGEIKEITTDASFEQLLKSMPKPHLCRTCISACVGGRNLKNAVITDAVKVRDGLYVADCSDYTEGSVYEPITDYQKTSEGYYRTVHPNVKHAFLSGK